MTPMPRPGWPEKGVTASPETPHEDIVFLSCCFLALLVSLDGIAVVITLPRIVSDLRIGNDFTCVANSFWLVGIIFQPLCAQLADVYGRKPPVLTYIAIFFLGGAISGWSRTAAALIAGRAVQGLGGGGIMLLMEVIVCDILSVREREKYLSIVLSTAAVGAIAGPPLGGVIADRNWRLIFWTKLPTAAGVFLVMAFLMRLRKSEESEEKPASRVDWIGAIMFASSLTSLLIGLVFGGTVYPWRSWHVVLPMVLGTLGASSSPHPTKADMSYLAYGAFLIPAAGVAGSLVSKTGLFQPYQFAGFALLTLGCGLNILLGPETSTAVWVVLIALSAVDLGSVMPTMLPAILASLPEKDVALATGMYSFLRSFGYIWGVTISAVIVNATFDGYSGQISNTTLRQRLCQGKAYQYVSGEFVNSLLDNLRTEVIGVYTKSLRVGWMSVTALAAVAMLLVFVEKHVPLRENLDTKYELE
ncbi:MFS general substrate transporter [Bimuria novae-zelandiae CBS 107.79]|uniref:MFS general substrate transporter n=1 Tax=Bimuria novae-zelandiae CBS 107.79 TaxID=1447943 RepID=A0A6A5VHF0_9PLEO|nr:MFS general substrate transporter [Bimuria novae-zelandiae CBS 107.79]